VSPAKLLTNRESWVDVERAEMTKTVSKRILTKSRSPAVTFVPKTTGLWIRIAMPQEEAKALAEKVGTKRRAKAKVSKVVISALRDLLDEDTRDRSGFLQADIPSQLKAQLAEVAKAKGADVTALIFDRLCEWIDPTTGELRLKKTKDGSPSREGPKNYRRYIQPTNAMYLEALKARSLARLQVQVGYKFVRRIRVLLYQNRISKSRFLTALAADVRDRSQPAASERSEAVEEKT